MRVTESERGDEAVLVELLESFAEVCDHLLVRVGADAPLEAVEAVSAK